MPSSGRDPAARRVGWLLFSTLFVAYAYFHQGGGWNQNVRFDQIRSLVEAGRWEINRYCAYEATAEGGIRRRPLADRWTEKPDLYRLNSWDISLHDGTIHPNKPPGTTLLAAPAYSLLWLLGRRLGIDADGWLGLTAGLYLTTVLSIGVLGALAGLLLFRLSRRLLPGLELRHHAAATLAFGLGTIFFPFSTMLFDHVAVATMLLAGMSCIESVGRQESARREAVRLAAAGLALGFAVLLNYAAVVSVALLAVYLLWRLERRRHLLFFVLGGLPSALFLAWYHRHAFGHVLANANTYQLARYTQDQGHLFGMLGAPDPVAVWQLLFSPFRGLFVYSPVLLVACYGFWRLWRRPGRKPEVVLSLGVFLSFLLINASFNNWHAGSTFGPRYLIPALPFLALPLAAGFARLPKLTWAVTVLSVTICLLGTATAPLVHFSVATPLLDAVLAGFAGRLPVDPVAWGAQGAYELGRYQLFGADSFAARWNSFNLGELLFPQSRLSLVPLLSILTAGGVLATRRRPRPPG